MKNDCVSVRYKINDKYVIGAPIFLRHFYFMAQRHDPHLQTQLAQKLKVLRAQKGVSQQQVYNDTDVHIGRIETGKMNATINTIAILSRYFGLTLAEFFAEGFGED